MLLVPVAGTPRLLRNDVPDRRWLRFKLVGTASNRDAVGSEVTLTTSTGTRRRLVSRTHGYLSQSEPVVTFGLAAGETPDVVAGAVADGRSPDADRAGAQSADDHHGSPLGQRSVRKNARTSSTSACGCSRAAKWPPFCIAVQRVML